MVTLIEISAGELWQYLDQNKGQSKVEKALQDIRMPKEMLLMGLGWLVREGHILIDGKLPNLIMKLKA